MKHLTLAVLGVGLVLAGCGPSSQPSPAEPTPSAVTILDVQQLAQELVFFESQGDSGLAVHAALAFESKWGCTTGYSLAYWQEEQRGEEALARVAAAKELDLEYQYVAGALADALLPLPYTSVSGEELEADFVGLLVGVNC